MRSVVKGALLGVVGLVVVACRPSDVLRVPPPAGVLASSELASETGAESAFNGAKGQLFNAADGNSNGQLEWSEMLTDEFTYAGFAFYAPYADIDARMTGAASIAGALGYTWQNLMAARVSLVLSVPLLQQNEPGSARSKIGEANALTGYAELLLAETFCAGTPLSVAIPSGGIQYGMPLTTDSILGAAETDLDSAVAEAHGDPAVTGLAAVGLGRVLVDRGQYSAAAAAVATVPTSFVYNMELQPNYGTGAPYEINLYAGEFPGNFGCGYLSVSDREGENGLNFISANDPRLLVDSTMQATCDGGTWYYPVKFGNPPTGLIPLATGVEARLIEAEAALHGGNAGAWAADLRALRADATDTQVMFPATDSLPADSAELATPDAQVDVMFRERAFWLFGTGERLGDLRRLIRQYGRDQSTVFPTGPYANGHNPNLQAPIPNYGTDVSFPLPSSATGFTETNPNYKWCVASTKVA